MEPTTRPTFRRDLRLFLLLGLTAAFLGAFLMAEQASLREAKGKITLLEGKLLGAKETVRKHPHLLATSGPKVLNSTLLAEKSLRTLVMEATEAVGISRNLESVNPTEDSKQRLVSAKVSLRNVPLRKIVEFIVALRKHSAGIRDRDAMMTMQGHSVDSWRIQLTIQAPMAMTAPSGDRSEDATGSS